MALTGITVFLSAFLLFLVQPIIAKLILPAFGGSVAGHLPAATLSPRREISFQGILAAAAPVAGLRCSNAAARRLIDVPRFTAPRKLLARR